MILITKHCIGDEMEGKIWAIGITSILVLTGILSGTAIAQGPHGQAGGSNEAHLYLHEKDPNTWEIIEDGAWGKMKYILEGTTFDFVFNGHGLEPEEEYNLIYYPDPWPGSGLICLGFGIANNGGNIHIQASVDTGDMPAEYDDNYPDGAKIWLVLSEDVDCENAQMVGWNPTEYLFEHNLIIFNAGR